MIKDEATPFWSHAIRTAGPARVVGGLLVTVASGIDAFASGSLISIAIASAGFGTSLWGLAPIRRGARSEEHTSELQSLMSISYAVFCLKKKKKRTSI